MAITINNQYQIPDNDADLNTIDTGNAIGEQEDTALIVDDYLRSDDADFLFVIGIGSTKDWRHTKLNLNMDGIDWLEMPAVITEVINFLNENSRGTVMRVYQEKYRHKNVEKPDTLPLRAVDDQQASVNFKVYATTSGYPNSYPVFIPYFDKGVSDADLLASAQALSPSLGFGHSGAGDIREVSLVERVSKRAQM